MPLRTTGDPRFRTAAAAPAEILAGLTHAELVAQHHALHSLTEAVLAHLSLHELLGTLLARLRAVLATDSATVLLCTDGNDELVVRASDGLETELDQQVRVPLGQGIAGTVAERREPVIVDDVRGIETVSPALRALRSMMVAPLVADGEVLGVLHVGTRAPRTFGDGELYLLQVVADRAALAIRNAILHDRARAGDAERARVDASLRESEQRYRSLFDHNPDPVFALDGDGRFVQANDACARVSGYAVGEMLGTRFAPLCTPDCREATVAAFADTMRGAPQHIDTAIIHRDGSRVELSVSSVPTYGRDGRIVGVFGVAEDVTQSRRAAEALERSEERYRSLVEAAAAIVWNMPAAAEAVWPMPQWAGFTGQAEPEYRGRGWLDAVHPDDRDATLARWTDADAARSVFRIEHRVRRRDGEYRHMEARAVAILDERGEVREWIGVHFDVTRQVEARQELERLYQEVTQASQTKSDFLATISHELRTPLNAIIGYAQLLEEGIPERIPDAARERVGRIHYSAQHLLGLIEEVLTFSRIEAGREPVRVEPTEAAAIVAGVAAVVEPLAQRKGIGFRAETPDEPLELVTDSSRARQILLNLLDNAIKFTAEGEVAVRAEAAGDDVVYTVRDTGVGIRPEHLQKIFDPFWQVEQHTTRAVEGAGLGLSVAYRLAQLLGGEIAVESEPGVGTTFTVRLPRRTPVGG